MSDTVWIVEADWESMTLVGVAWTEEGAYMLAGKAVVSGEHYGANLSIREIHIGEVLPL